MTQPVYLRNLEAEASGQAQSELAPVLRTADWLLGHVSRITEHTKMEKFSLLVMVEHMLLKQAVTSLRATEILVMAGYTAQAAAIACGLFEIELYSGHLLRDPTRVEKYMGHRNSKHFVWQPRDMIRDQALAKMQKAGHKDDPQGLAEAISLIDGPYLFLNSIKHTNPLTLKHFATTMAREEDIAKGVPRFGALPDIRREDIVVKLVILSETIMATMGVAVNALNSTGNLTRGLVVWLTELKTAQSAHLNDYVSLGQKHGPMPFATVRPGQAAG